MLAGQDNPVAEPSDIAGISGGAGRPEDVAGRRRRIADDLPDVRCASGLVEGGATPRWWARLVVPRRCVPPPPRRFNLFACHGVGAERRWLAWRPQRLAAPDFHDPGPYAPLDLAW